MRSLRLGVAACRLLSPRWCAYPRAEGTTPPLDAPRLTLTTINLSAPDPGALARFYARLLSWEIAAEEPDWVMLRSPEGGVALSVQIEPSYVRPTWPAGPGDQQMMMHLEIRVDDLEGAPPGKRKRSARRWPSTSHRTMSESSLDPAGHPFCLWLGE